MPESLEGGRYERQIAIEGFGEASQKKLAEASVFIAGVGGLGCSASLYLAAAGVGRLVLLDSGSVETSNLNRQILYTEEDLGAPKAKAAAARLSSFAPSVRVLPLAQSLQSLSPEPVLAGCDVIVDALDNFASRFVLNELALGLGAPLVHGAVDSFSGQVMEVLPGKSACLMCLYGKSVRERTTPVLGAAAGLVGSLMALAAIRLITGLGEAMAGRLIFFDGASSRFSEIHVDRDPECPHCGRRPAARG